MTNKQRVLGICGYLGEFTLWGFVIAGAFVTIIAKDRLVAVRTISIEMLVFATIKYTARWIFHRYSEPVHIDYAENGTVIGYKVLEWHGNETVSSPIYPYLWKTGWNKCNTHRIGGRPGFHAYKDSSKAWGQCTASYWFVAKLEMAGKVVVCEDGYRSECARVVEILSKGFSIRRDFESHIDMLLVSRTHDNYQ